jgi:hypothetical protein
MVETVGVEEVEDIEDYVGLSLPIRSRSRLDESSR